MARIIWTSVNVEGSKLIAFLNQYNLQPGEFHLIPCIDGSPNWITIVFIERRSAA